MTEEARELVNDNVIDMRLKAIEEKEKLRNERKKQRKAEKRKCETETVNNNLTENLK